MDIDIVYVSDFRIDKLEHDDADNFAVQGRAEDFVNVPKGPFRVGKVPAVKGGFEHGIERFALVESFCLEDLNVTVKRQEKNTFIAFFPEIFRMSSSSI